MLTVTENAQTLVKTLVDQPEVPEDGGLRIAPVPAADGQLEVTVVATAEAGDDVVDAGGARVFLEPQVATMLSEAVLDAQDTPQGPGFVLRSTTD